MAITDYAGRYEKNGFVQNVIPQTNHFFYMASQIEQVDTTTKNQFFTNSSLKQIILFVCNMAALCVSVC